MTSRGFNKFFIIILIFIFTRALPSSGFALLSHEAIVDALWEKSIKPILKQKYPKATDEELKKAHAYVYGGAIIPDIGYYPFGSSLFSNLIHYVRNGDFIKALFEESHNINDYAFAIGVLSHYEADNYGHSLGTNEAVPILFPRLQKRHGKEVTYEQGRDRHTRVEWGFDVLQTAKGNYKSNAYHDFIGFEINDSLLDRAFLKTYGLRLKDVFTSFPIAISALRFSVKSIIPELTKNAWKIKKSFITQLNPLATEKNFYYKTDRDNYRKEFNQTKVQSIFFTLIIGGLPKYGPLSRFKPKLPNQQCEKLYEQSFDAARNHFYVTLEKVSSKDAFYKNIDMDTGRETEMGEYKLADKTYYELLKKLKRNKFFHIDEGLKQNLIDFYSKHDTSKDYGTHSRKGKKIAKTLEQLNTTQANQDSHE